MIEFNLSERKLETWKLAKGFPNTYKEEDVKEFIRLLKERIADTGHSKVIDKLAGSSFIDIKENKNE